MTTYSLMIHGGAGQIQQKAAAKLSIKQVLQKGEQLLKKGASATDVVEYCVTLLENDPLFNAGRGAVLDTNGNISLDASIMQGSDLNAGAVAAISGVKNPVQLARKVMENSDHVFLIGNGAEEFAGQQNVLFKPVSYFITQKRLDQLAKAKQNNVVVLDHASIADKKFGTVGAVARDLQGNLAAATSTGGLVNKKFGRVGDTPVIGAGVYAENATCAVSATGYGEQFLRTSIAKHIAEIVRHTGADAQTAAQAGIAHLIKSVNGLGGVIVIDAKGNCAKAYSTSGLVYGHVRKGQQPVAALK